MNRLGDITCTSALCLLFFCSATYSIELAPQTTILSIRVEHGPERKHVYASFRHPEEVLSFAIKYSLISEIEEMAPLHDFIPPEYPLPENYWHKTSNTRALREGVQAGYAEGIFTVGETDLRKLNEFVNHQNQVLLPTDEPTYRIEITDIFSNKVIETLNEFARRPPYAANCYTYASYLADETYWFRNVDREVISAHGWDFDTSEIRKKYRKTSKPRAGDIGVIRIEKENARRKKYYEDVHAFTIVFLNQSDEHTWVLTKNGVSPWNPYKFEMLSAVEADYHLNPKTDSVIYFRPEKTLIWKNRDEELSSKAFVTSSQ
jgi:hypothetical protein